MTARAVPEWRGKRPESMPGQLVLRSKRGLPADHTGRTFGKWTALSRGSNRGVRTTWLCRCDCGTEREVMTNHLVRGTSKSCGCTPHTVAEPRSEHPLYGTWCNIVQRCTNPNNPQYRDYGARGIRMCDEWRADFLQFVADMGEKPTPVHTVERKDNDKGYGPDNCEWADRTAQNRNTRRNHLVLYNGRLMPLVEACELSGVNYGTAKWRLRNGRTEEEAFR